MEVIRISGYTEQEKTAIAQRHLIDKQVKSVGLAKGKHIEFAPEGIRAIIERYTREAGVRSLEREIGNVCRKVALKVVRSKAGKRVAKTKVTPRTWRSSFACPSSRIRVWI